MNAALFIVIAVAFGFISGYLWQKKGGNFFLGFVLGFLLGLIGLIIVLILKPSQAQQPAMTRSCPHCQAVIPAGLAVCPNCQRQSPPWVYYQGRWWTKNDAGTDYWLDERSGQWVAHTQVQQGPTMTG